MINFLQFERILEYEFLDLNILTTIPIFMEISIENADKIFFGLQWLMISTPRCLKCIK